MAQMKVFVSHSHADDAFCRALVEGLTRAGADVWYDEHDLGTWHLYEEIQQELGQRPVFVVVLSKSAFASKWVRDECEWAYNLSKRKPERLILPVVGAPYDEDDFDTLLYLESMKRIEAEEHMPYPQAEAVARTLYALQLTLPGGAPLSTVQESEETAEDVVTRGKALLAQKLYEEALAAYDEALTLDPDFVYAWANKGTAMRGLGRAREADEADMRAKDLWAEQANRWAGESFDE